MRKRVRYVLVSVCVLLIAGFLLLCFLQRNGKPDKHNITANKGVYQEKNIHINYPQLEGVAGEEKQNVINALIAEDVVCISSEVCKKLSNAICAEAYRIKDNELLCEYFKEELMDAERITELLGGQFYTEYFVIDLNEDEYEDYLVRLEGAGYSGSGGDSVYILVGEKEGLRTVFAGTIRFSSGDVKYGPFVVLKEKTKDMHDVVFTAYDKVWKYNELADCYESFLN